MAKPVRMKDVAQKVGVSVSTVSRVLNGIKTDYISKETEEKINFTAYTMGYKKNVLAQALTGGETYLIDVQIPSDYNYLIRNLIDLSLKSKYCIITRDIEAYYLANKDIVNLSFDGIISNVDGFLLEKYMKNQTHKNCVSIGHHCSRKFDYVYEDFYDGVCEGLEYYIQKGARHIAYLTDDLMALEREEKVRAYLNVLEKYSIEPIFINTKGTTYEEIYNTIYKTFQDGSKIDCIFCHSDLRYHPTIKALKDCGVNDKVKVFSSEHKKQTDGSIPRVVADYCEIAETAWEFLMNRIEKPNIPLQKSILKYKFEI